MSDWQLTSVGAVSTRVTKGTTPKVGGYTTRGISFVKVESITAEGQFIPEKFAHINEETNLLLARSILQEDDLLFSIAGTIGRVARVSAQFLPANTNQALAIIRPDKAKIDVGFLLYCLRDKIRIQDALALVVQSVQANLSLSELSSIQIPLPPLPEQQAIAEVLGALDDKIAANSKLAATADEYIRASLAELMADATDLITIENLATNRKELTDPNSLDPSDNYVGLEHIPRRSMWLHAAGTADAVTSTKASFHAGDILFGKLRPYFHKVISAPFAGVCSTDILVLTPLSAELSGFVLASVASDFVVERVTAASEGTRMPRTSWKDLAAVEVAWPGADKAREFSVGVATLRETIESLVLENRVLAATRDALLPQLMSGKFRVKDSESAVSTMI
ncbi:restriction endonuclease subunit S [Specibacter sp. AOP5-B1-6]|uniref:restriction endonuclease subunit S n=1 Tax=Specibacter sp. AOP5-B1-6 TaxID=3457653 RepID=UPI003FB947A0